MKNDFSNYSRISLFITSYAPMILIMIVRQIGYNYSKLEFTNIDCGSVLLFFRYYGFSLFLFIALMYGWYGAHNTFKSLKKYTNQNADKVNIAKIHDKNSEIISYIATYIIPLLFEKFIDIVDIFSFFFLFFVIGYIYINSSLILINPMLAILYKVSFLEITFLDKEKEKNGFLITNDDEIAEGVENYIFKIGHRLFFNYKE